jgi:3-oxoacyl-[acyl-carrier protein] reductase
MIDPKLEGKVALVTGANHGIGASTAKVLAGQGVRVFMAYYRAESPYSEDELETARRTERGGPFRYHALQQQGPEHVLDAIHADGGTAVAEHVDLGDPEAAVSLVDRCENALGPVDILINNHAHCELETFDPAVEESHGFNVAVTDKEGMDLHYAVNARASALMMKEYLKRHIDRQATWGRIISLTTALAHAWNISYAASKRALVSYTLSAAQEMGKYGITANVVCPGATQTGYIGAEEERRCVARTPLGRLGTPDDVADAILLLVSEQAHWLTGQLIYASGGFSMFMRE